jgi:hypothetical protein
MRDYKGNDYVAVCKSVYRFRDEAQQLVLQSDGRSILLQFRAAKGGALAVYKQFFLVETFAEHWSRL